MLTKSTFQKAGMILSFFDIIIQKKVFIIVHDLFSNREKNSVLMSG